MNILVKKYIKEFFFLLGCGLIFSIPALINGFPLVTSETGAYINSGFEMKVPLDSPIVYGLFIDHFSMRDSLWFVVIAQGLLLAWLISRSIKIFLPGFSNFTHRIIIIVLLSLFAAPAWYSSQIMPDIFASVSILCVIILLFDETQTKLLRRFLYLLFVFSVLSDNSHLFFCTFLVIALFIWGILFKQFKKYKQNVFRFYRVLLLTIFCWIFAPVINTLVDGHFRFTGATHAFAMARLSEAGILKKYLDQDCHFIKSVTDLKKGTPYIIEAKHSDRCLEIQLNSKDTIKPLTQWNFDNKPYQKFFITALNDGCYKLRNIKTSKYLTVDASEKDHNYIVDYPEFDEEMQEFDIEKVEGDCFRIMSPLFNRSFDVDGVNKNDGGRLHLWEYFAGDNQKFHITADTNACSLCLYKDVLPNNSTAFLSPDDGVLKRTGGLGNKSTTEEYKSVILKILSKPKLLLWGIRQTVISVFEQLIHSEAGSSLEDKDSPYRAIKEHLPNDINSFSVSHQFINSMDYEMVNKRMFWGYLFSTFVLLFILFIKPVPTNNPKLLILSTIILFSSILNALTTAISTSAINNMGSNISWLIVLVSIIYCYPKIILMANTVIERFKG